MEDTRQFDWADNKGSIVVHRVDAIAIHNDSEGDILIRQQRADFPYDVVITLPRQYAYSVIEGIQRQVKAPFATTEAVAEPLESASLGISKTWPPARADYPPVV